MKITDGPIVPAVGIGNIKLGMTKAELTDKIGESFKEKKLGIGCRLDIENAAFWTGEDGRVWQIGVRGDFKGKFRDTIGIGSTLRDVEKYIGNYAPVYYTYELEGIKGICFELEDIDTKPWDERTAPIEWIFVYELDNAEKASGD